jgi:LysM repeat protein
MVAIPSAPLARNPAAAWKPAPTQAELAPRPTPTVTKGGDATAAPAAMAAYTVQKGDTLSSIAREHKTDVDTLLKSNPQIKDRDLIHAGSVMKIPAATTEAVTKGSSAVCRADEAPPARRPADAATQAGARRAAAGREEMIRRNLERAPSSSTKPETKATPRTELGKPAARPLEPPAVAEATATPSVRSFGSHGQQIATTAERLKQVDLISDAERAELLNGQVNHVDTKILGSALDRLQASTPGARELLFAIPAAQGAVVDLQREGLERTMGSRR